MSISSGMGVGGVPRRSGQPPWALSYALSNEPDAQRIPLTGPGNLSSGRGPASDASHRPLATRPEHVTQGDDLVGHQAVHAQVQQAVHLSGPVDRPDVHLLAA